MQKASIKSKIACEICNEKYTLLSNRESVCKRCKRSVCKNCCKYTEKVVISLVLPAKDDKVCSLCKEEMDFQKCLQSANRTTWNFNSKVTQIWLRFLKFGSLESVRQIFDEANDTMRSQLDKKYKIALEIQENVRQEVLKMYQEPNYWNYSFIDWFYKNIRNIHREEVQDALKRVVGCLLAQNPEIGYSKELVQTTAFILTFARDYVAYAVLQRIYFLVLPDSLLPSSYMSSSVLNVQDNLVQEALSEFQQQFRVQPGDLPAVRKFMEYTLISYKSSLFINLLNVEIVYSILNESLDLQSTIILDRYYIVMVRVNLNQIKRLGASKALTATIIKETNVKEVKELCQQVELRESKRPLLVTKVPKLQQPRKTMMVQKSQPDFNDGMKTERGMTSLRSSQVLSGEKSVTGFTGYNGFAVDLSDIFRKNGSQYERGENLRSSFVSTSQRGWSVEYSEAQKIQQILNDQLNDILVLKDQIRQKDLAIVKAQKDTEILQQRIKTKQDQSKNMKALVKTEIQMLDHLSNDLFGGSLMYMEDAIV